MANILPISHFRLHDMLVRELDEEIAKQTQPLADGSVSGIEDYWKRVGTIRGLVLAQEIAEDLRKKVIGE